MPQGTLSCFAIHLVKGGFLETWYMLLCHHDAVSKTIGNSISCMFLSKNSAKTCHTIWFTGIIGLLKYSHNNDATVFQTTSDHGNHGWVVTDMLSTFFILSRPISLSTAIIFSLWSLDAISGTTHPNSLCSWTCEYANNFSTVKVSQSKLIIHIDVSSQLVSIARVECCFIKYLILCIKICKICILWL